MAPEHELGGVGECLGLIGRRCDINAAGVPIELAREQRLQSWLETAVLQRLAGNAGNSGELTPWRMSSKRRQAFQNERNI
jgi:hypothetical protein